MDNGEDGGMPPSDNGDAGSASIGDVFAALGAVDPSGDSNRGSGSSGGSSSGGDGVRDSGGTLFDPEQHIDPGKFNADGTFRRRRAKRGTGTSGTRRANSKGAASVETIANALAGIHFGIAGFTGFEDLKLTDDESSELAKGVAEVAKHYDLPAFDPKVLAWVSLTVIAGRVYMPKAALIKMEIDKRKAEKEGKGELVPFFNPKKGA